MTLHERIATVLGWTVGETQTFSLLILRELVRPLDAKLAAEIAEVVLSGEHIRGERPR